MTTRCLFTTVALFFFNIVGLQGADWITAPSTFTHDPTTLKRVTQYSPIGPIYVFPRGDFTQSGYRHTRSSIAAGGSVDHLHIVEEWGNPVRPYDEWRYPYRPYSTPYPNWGAPYAGLGQPYGYGGFGPGFPGGGWGGGGGGPGPAFQPPVNYGQQPWFNDHYPTYDRHDRAPYYFPYQGPYNSANGFGGADGTTGTP